MSRHALLALGIAAIAVLVEYGLVLRWDVAQALVPDPGTRFIVYTVIGFPVIEELARYGVLTGFGSLATRRGWRPLRLRDFGVIGLLVGALEVLVKLGSGNSPSLLEGIGTLTSFPIHFALTLAYAALPRWRLIGLIVLHAAINLFVVVLSTLLTGLASSLLFYTAFLLAAVGALCSLIAHLAMKRAGAGGAAVGARSA